MWGQEKRKGRPSKRRGKVDHKIQLWLSVVALHNTDWLIPGLFGDALTFAKDMSHHRLTHCIALRNCAMGVLGNAIFHTERRIQIHYTHSGNKFVVIEPDLCSFQYSFVFGRSRIRIYPGTTCPSSKFRDLPHVKYWDILMHTKNISVPSFKTESRIKISRG
jgi:hypothetical protein